MTNHSTLGIVITSDGSFGEFGVVKARFLGIDTPESTGTIEPWGKASSAYAKEVLYSAYSIVLEAEGTADAVRRHGFRKSV